MRLMDLMIDTNRFDEFIRETIRIRNEEQEEQAIWEMWLHKVHDMTFNEFNSRVTNGADSTVPSTGDIIQTVKDSFGLLNGFSPDGVQKNDGDLPAAGDGSH